MAGAPCDLAATGPGKVTLGQIFGAFLLIGATSVGGGVVAYLRNSLVDKHRWLDDATFVRMLAISQSLPGLNATNIAILAGDHLRGAMGAVTATVAVCLPGGLLMFAVGMAYGQHAGKPVVAAMLHTIGAAAVGLVLGVAVQLGRKSLTRLDDLVFVALAAVGVAMLHLSVLVVLIGVGTLSILWYRPRRNDNGAPP